MKKNDISYSDINLYNGCQYSFYIKNFKNEIKKYNDGIEETIIINSLINQYLGQEQIQFGKLLEYEHYKVDLSNINGLSTKDIQKLISKFKSDIEQQSALQDIKKEISISTNYKFSQLFFDKDLKYSDKANIFIQNDNKKYIVLIKYKYGSITSYDFEQLDYMATILLKQFPHIDTIYEYLYYPKENYFNRKKVLSNETSPIYKSINLQTTNLLSLPNDETIYSRKFSSCGKCPYKYACTKKQQIEEFEETSNKKMFIGDTTSSYSIIHSLYSDILFEKYSKMYKNGGCKQVWFIGNDIKDLHKKSNINFIKKFIEHSELNKVVVYDKELIHLLFQNIDELTNKTVDELDKEVFKVNVGEKVLYMLYLKDIDDSNNDNIIEYFQNEFKIN